ncbi:MAG: peptide deformylase [Microbacteriaceae bacterium]|nr:peptide deformylase [Microbacteriaceae bacterium]
MAVRPIVITGEGVLHQPATEVTAFDATLRELVHDMEETMAAAPGVGLAAPQVGVPLRVFVWRWTDDTGVEHAGTAVNPVLWISPPPPGEPDEEAESEGCLSLPGERFPLRRAENAILQAADAEGEPFEVRVTGWLARIFQHEFDHLNGILYSDRLMYPHSRAITKVIRKRSWGTPGISWRPGIDHLED